MEQLPNLLIVDDSKLNLTILETIIKNLKVNLIQALSGSEALEKTRGMDLALAIVDVQMPVMNGYELALKMNEERSDDKVPIIFLTANFVDKLQVFEGYNTGAVDYIFKPVESHILICKINIFLDLFNQKQAIIQNAVKLKESAEELNRLNVALKKSEAKYKSYIDNAPDGVFVSDENGKYIEVNEAACRITGYSKDEILNMSITEILTEETLEESLVHLKALLKDGSSKADFLFKHKNGTNRWWTLESVKLAKTRYLGFAKDITERKITEEKLKSALEQLHQLSKYTEQVRENERIAISRELHDDLGQALTAVKIDLGIIKQTITDKAIVLKMNNVFNLVGETIKTVQRITSQLRPPVIDDLGIVAAIDWYTKEFAQRNNIKVFLEMDSELNIPPDVSLIIFRIMQESLTNISRHSKANRADIVLKRTINSVSLKISDNGIGIAENQIKSMKSFGLMGMMERATSLGGTFDICSESKKGTVIKLFLPLNTDLK
jgi:two-component system sensor histidine kinase UhpB